MDRSSQMLRKLSAYNNNNLLWVKTQHGVLREVHVVTLYEAIKIFHHKKNHVSLKNTHCIAL